MGATVVVGLGPDTDIGSALGFLQAPAKIFFVTTKVFQR
ncbi:hypothetical protein C4K26_3418 [Pseudomonas chlororaphis]|nr:hypothetical protein C4K26_3418 [Pseudomonas chlororaphis]